MKNSPLNRKVGLALSSGAGRGLAHIGVLETLEREGIPINMIAGTSMGAVIGAMYAQGKSIGEIKEATLDLGWREMVRMLAFSTPKTGFLSGRKIKSRLEEIFGDADFADLKIPFACVAADILTGEEVVMQQGPVLEAVVASISIPIIFRADRRNERYLVDGGMVNPVPVSVVRNMGADFVIASSVVVEPVDRTRNIQPEESYGRKWNRPNIFNIMLQFVNITSYQSVKYGLSDADVVIQPSVADIGFTDFGNARKCITRGSSATDVSVAEIKRLLADVSLRQISGV